MSTRQSADFAPGQYLLSLSPAQLRLVLGDDIAATVGDHYCRISPLDPTVLDLWLTPSTCAGGTYERNPVERPQGWDPYTVEARYYNNDQPYTQTVLAASEDDARDEVQAVAYYANSGPLEGDDELEDTLDIESVTPGYGEDEAPVSVRNANSLPQEFGYVVAMFIAGTAYQRLDGRHQDTPDTSLFRLAVDLARDYFNDLPREQASMLDDDEIWLAADRLLDGADHLVGNY